MILDEACKETNQVERDHAAVVVRGKGLELGYCLRRLQALGLIQQFQRQPGYFRKRLGGLPTDIVALTEEGRSVARNAHTMCQGKPLSAGSALTEPQVQPSACSQSTC